MKHMGYSAMFFVLGCGAAPDQDARHAEVVVEATALSSAAARAVRWWHVSTEAEVAFTVVDACTAGHVCVHVHTGELEKGAAGLTAYPVGHPEDCDTTVSSTLEPRLQDITVAHELGHVLGLAHDDGVMTADITDATWDLPTEWSAAR